MKKDSIRVQRENGGRKIKKDSERLIDDAPRCDTRFCKRCSAKIAAPRALRFRSEPFCFALLSASFYSIFHGIMVEIVSV